MAGGRAWGVSGPLLRCNFNNVPFPTAVRRLRRSQSFSEVTAETLAGAKRTSSSAAPSASFETRNKRKEQKGKSNGRPSSQPETRLEPPPPPPLLCLEGVGRRGAFQPSWTRGSSGDPQTDQRRRLRDGVCLPAASPETLSSFLPLMSATSLRIHLTPLR